MSIVILSFADLVHSGEFVPTDLLPLLINTIVLFDVNIAGEENIL